MENSKTQLRQICDGKYAEIMVMMINNQVVDIQDNNAHTMITVVSIKQSL